MKLMHTTTTTLNTREFNELSDKIADNLYRLSPEIQDLYDIHINYIDESWRVDFVPRLDNIPVLKVSVYTDYSGSSEVLHISPESLTELPKQLRLRDEDKSYDLCMNYVAILDFILSLYDFEYKL